MEWFKEDGHLTDEGLLSLIDESNENPTQPATELQRLEAAEHLSFCDSCLLRYTELLSDDTLLQPPAPVHKSVMRRLRQRGARILFSRYATVAAAVVLAVAMWFAGSLMLPEGEQKTVADTAPPAGQQAATEKGEGLGTRLSSAFSTAVNGVSDFFSALLPQPAQPQAPQPPQPERRQPRRAAETENENREKLFQTPADNSGLPADNSKAA